MALFDLIPIHLDYQVTEPSTSLAQQMYCSGAQYPLEWFLSRERGMKA